ncbi:MAG: hypothetical protein F4213_08575 [Boseongicola sp. SB0677_bin_26]|nr:hypothetical protein [Boseongicola sp. SB0665_bin_10]MYG26066.1 hypothetical protein [Boseongicola sp. SB0677_bin_26]
MSGVRGGLPARMRGFLDSPPIDGREREHRQCVIEFPRPLHRYGLANQFAVPGIERSFCYR